MSDELARDFDEEREERNSKPATFKIGGETFSYKRGLRPETFDRYISQWAALTPGSKDSEAIPACDLTIQNFLADEETAERWRALRLREEDAITVHDMIRVVQFLVREQTERPTEAPSGSGNGGARTGSESTESSSSDQAVRVVSAA